MMHEFCSVCDRVAWGDIVRLGFGKWRHDACYPGSKAWLEQFRLLPEGKKTAEGKLIYEASVSESMSIGVSQPTEEEKTSC